MSKRFKGSIESIDDLGNICRGLIIQCLDQDNYLVYFFKRFSPPDSPDLDNPRIVNAKYLRDLDDNNFSVRDKILVNFQDTRENRINKDGEGDLFYNFGDKFFVIEFLPKYGELTLISASPPRGCVCHTNQTWLVQKDE